MARTRTAMRQLVAQQFPHKFISGTIDGSGNTTTSFVDSNVIGEFDDDDLIGAWIYLSSGSPSSTDLRVLDNDQGNESVTFRPTLGSAPDSLNYEILPYSATEIHQKLDEAIKEGYDRGWLTREFWLNHWLTGSPIYNPTFDYWTDSTTPDGWLKSSVTATRVQHTAAGVTVVPGESLVEFSGSAGFIESDRRYRRFLSEFRGHTVNLRAWLWATNANEIRLRLLVDGSVVATSDYHSGDGTWEMISIEDYSVADGATEIRVRIDVPDPTGTPRCGAIWLEGGPRISEYPFPVTLAPAGPSSIFYAPVHVDSTNLVARKQHHLQPLENWSIYRYRDEQATTETGVLVFHGGLPPVRNRLWMPATVPLSLPTADTDNIEVATPEDLLLAKMTALNLILPRIGKSEALSRKAGDLRAEIQELSEGRGSSTKHAVPLGMDW